MRTRNSLFISFLVLSLVFLNGCQKEVTQIIDPASDEAFSPESQIADLVQRTSLRDGSFDNIVDGSSCTSLELPITVVVNGLEVILDSQEDFYTIEHLIDKFDDDDDIIEIIFPVTVILADHSKVILSDEKDLENLIDQCTEDGNDDDIECVDFKFPLTISIYDAGNQLSDVISVDNDKELYKLIHDLDDQDIASFNFPITVILDGGDEMIINDHDELEDILKSAINTCDEDDDNDHNDDDVDDTQLFNVLIDGNWEITYFFDDKDETADFTGHVFTFFENGMAKAKKGEVIVEGSWYSNGDDGALELELNFGDNAPFDELQEDWDIIEFDGTIIKLKDISGGDGSIAYLTFSRPSGNPGGTNPDIISNVIIEGIWVVANYNDSGIDETVDFKDYVLDFATDGTVKVMMGEDFISGTWSITTNDGINKLVLDFGENIPFNEFNDDWDIVDVKEARIELKDISGDGSVSKLVFEKHAGGNGDPNAPLLSEVIVAGEWLVANYNDSGVDETAHFNDFKLNFAVDGKVTATKGDDMLSGTWSVKTIEGIEKLILDFGESIPFNEFNDDWEIVDVKEARIELKDVSGGDGSISKLVFEKI